MDLGSVHNLREWVNRDRRRLTPKIKRGPPFKKSAFPIRYTAVFTHRIVQCLYTFWPHGGKLLDLKSYMRALYTARQDDHWFRPLAYCFPHHLSLGPPWGKIPPSFRYWGPHWGPHGAPWGAQWGPMGAPMGANFPHGGHHFFVPHF